MESCLTCGVLIVWLSVSVLLIIININFFLFVLGWILLALFLGFILWAILDENIFEPRRKIADAFKKANNGSESDIKSLLDIVIGKECQFRYASKRLTQLTSQTAIDLLCQRWAKTRNQELTEIIQKAGYVATQPDRVRVLTALKVNKIEVCADQNPQLMKSVFDCFEDQDEVIAKRARLFPTVLSNQKLIDHLFYLFVREDNQVAYQAIMKAGYQPSDPKHKALFHVLRDEWEAYEALDFDQSLLLEIYRDSGSERRKLIAEKARQQGWTQWLTVASQRGKDLDKMTVEEWQVTLAILKNNRDYLGLWQLITQAPPWVCREALIVLSTGAWQPAQEIKAIVQELAPFARACEPINPQDVMASALLCSAWGDYEAISADWQFLLTVYRHNKYPKVWRVEDGQLTVDRHDKNPKVWRVEDGQLLCSAEGDYKAISSDWQFLVLVNYENKTTTKVWRIRDGQLLCSAEGYYQKNSADWQFLLTVDRHNKNPKVWRVEDGQLLCSAEGNYTEISADWYFLLTSDNGKTKMWRVRDGQLLCSAEGDYKAISSDWQFLVTSGEEETKVWRVGDGQLLCSVEGDYKEISADWQFLVTRGGGGITNVWRVRDGQLLCSAGGYYKEISADWQFLVTWGGGGIITNVWRVRDGQLLCSAEGYYEAISADWQFLVTSGNKTTEVWQVGDGQLLCSAQGAYQNISADWQFLFTYENGITKVWRVGDGQLLCSAQGYQKISADWQFLVTVEGEWNKKCVKVWQIRDGQLLCSAQGAYKKISADWQFLLTSDNGKIKVWRVGDGQLLCSAEGDYEAISADWQFLLTVEGERNKNPKVWRVGDGQLLCSVEGQYKEISADWQFLVTSGGGDTKVWSLMLPEKFIDKLAQNFTLQDLNSMKEFKNVSHQFINPQRKPVWLDFMIKLAEYKLRFDVEISDDSPVIEMDEFDIEIEG